LPSSKTTILSALSIVLILCATIITVLFLVFSFNASLNFTSVLKSKAEKLSSKTNISGSIATALAIDKRCF
jgi:type II secretory pathway component PulC